MARIRTIKPKFWDDIKLSKISRDARLLFIGMWNFSDDQGVIIAEPVWIKSKVFPYDTIQLQQFERWLAELSKSGFISLFSHQGEEFYYLPNFTRHQVINRPNYDDLFVKKEVLDSVDTLSLNDHGLITDTSVQERKGKDNIKARVDTRTDIDFQKFIDRFNELGKRQFKVTEKVKQSLKARVKEYTKEQILQAAKNAHLDPFHIENGFKHLTPEFILRPEKLEKFLNTSVKKQGYSPKITN